MSTPYYYRIAFSDPLSSPIMVKLVPNTSPNERGANVADVAAHVASYYFGSLKTPHSEGCVSYIEGAASELKQSLEWRKVTMVAGYDMFETTSP